MAEHYYLNVDCRTLDAVALGVVAQLTDPPYDPHVHEQMTSCAQVGDVKGVRHRDAGFAPLSASLFDYIVTAAKAIPGWSAIYTDLESIGMYRDALVRRHPKTAPAGAYIRTVVTEYEPADYSGALPWVRWSSPQQSDDRPPQGAEAVVLAHGPGKMSWRGPRNLTRLEHKCERGAEKHATAKPLDQALDLVSWFTEPGDLVYDPTGGRGTFGVACALLGRSYVGCNWGAGPDAALAKVEWEKGQYRIQEAKAGRLSQRDTERLKRWLESVLVLTGFDPKLCPDEVARAVSGGFVPKEFQALTKGKAEALLQ